jgi:hypothetical protein
MAGPLDGRVSDWSCVLIMPMNSTVMASPSLRYPAKPI